MHTTVYRFTLWSVERRRWEPGRLGAMKRGSAKRYGGHALKLL